MGLKGMRQALVALAIGWASVGCNTLLGIHELSDELGSGPSLDGGPVVSQQGGPGQDASLAGDGGKPSADGGVTAVCVPGVSCVPPNPCHQGEVVCSSGGVPTCHETDKLQDNGTTCDENSVCHDGVCTGCAAGTSCPVAGKPCRVGTIDCSTGGALCMESDNAQNGSVCGTGLVCQGGDCITCVTGQPCTPANACHVGTLDCSQGNPACIDKTTNLAPGSSCAKDSVCDTTGKCISCMNGAPCDVPGKPCRTGTTACNTGTPVCIESDNRTNGATCGTGMVCSGGACVACVAGLSCVPANPCHNGTTACSPTISCTDLGTNVNNGMSCGTDKVCSQGTCTACPAGKSCQLANACHVGTTSCMTGVSTCVDTGNQKDGTTCGTNQVCSAGACGDCSPGTTCTPTNRCHAGTLACSTGLPVCTDATTSLMDGTTCGTGQVCHTGQCVTCAAGGACQPTSPCKVGTFSCSTGTQVCNESGNKAPGTSCGTGMVCDTTGSCVACHNGDSCVPANPCHTGTIACGTGAPVCNDTGSAMSNGTGCGTNLVCFNGTCSACTPNLTCTPSNACMNGVTACGTGQQLCTATTNRSAGSSCTGGVCNGTGTCVPCNAGGSCTPAGNPCHQGTFACNTGGPVCIDSNTAVSDGMNCGANLFCLGGACKSCTPNATCQPNACQNGTTSCSTGTSMCTVTTNKSSGTSCGAGQSCTGSLKTAAAVCNANGQCPTPATTTCASGCNQAGTDCLSCAAGTTPCNGVCCASGQSCCSNVCVNLTTTANCGSCGAVCSSGQVCSSGTCCTSGQTSCSGVCKNLQTDTSNCGTCGNKCATGQTCTNGVCTCSGVGNPCTLTPAVTCKTGVITCATSTSLPVCSATNSPPGTSCGTNMFCNAGTCSPCTPGVGCNPNNNICQNGTVSCATGVQQCIFSTNAPSSTGCGNTSASCNAATGVVTNPQHCDGAGTCAPASTTTCASGFCSGTGCLNCPTGQAACSAKCVTLSSDTANCGSCGHACASGQICSNGVCCGSGQTNCNGTCATLSTDPNNCLSCGTVCRTTLTNATPTCTATGCSFSCINSTTNCSGACVDTMTSASNCGTCGRTCSTACRAGACTACTPNASCAAATECKAGGTCDSTGATCVQPNVANNTPCASLKAGICTSGACACYVGPSLSCVSGPKTCTSWSFESNTLEGWSVDTADSNATGVVSNLGVSAAPAGLSAGSRALSFNLRPGPNGGDVVLTVPICDAQGVQFNTTVNTYAFSLFFMDAAGTVPLEQGGGIQAFQHFNAPTFGPNNITANTASTIKSGAWINYTSQLFSGGQSDLETSAGIVIHFLQNWQGTIFVDNVHF